MSFEINPQKYYRLPWSLTDNGISWLEVTTKCNLACKGCYRDQDSGGHKTLDEISADLDVFAAVRRSDCISIAGGDPLVHPRIVDIVATIRRRGWKPVLNTNGLALTPDLLHELKMAGVAGFTIHIDTSQKRPDNPSAVTESDHNPLRQKYAEMLAREGGIACSFNQTVKHDTLEDIPAVVRWATAHADIVHTMVFILYREPNYFGDSAIYANGREIDLGSVYDNSGWGGQDVLEAADVAARIQEADPHYEPCGYLNGTVDPGSTKWLLAMRVGTRDRTYGYASPRFMEFAQNANHLLRKRWLSYASPRTMAAGKMATLAFSLVDGGMRTVAGRFLASAFVNPSLFFKKAYLQGFMVIQPIDTMPDGQMNMCDGCPDMTVHDGKLYWSCRLEEIKKYGAFVSAVPRHLDPGRNP